MAPWDREDGLARPGARAPPAKGALAARWRACAASARRRPGLAAAAAAAALLSLYVLVGPSGAPRVDHLPRAAGAPASPTSAQAPALAHALTGGEEFTVLINTFKRPDRLKRATAHYRTCPGVAEVRVCWSEVDVEPPQDAPATDRETAVYYDRHAVNRLSNRYRVPPTVGRFATEAILSIDDDIYLNCGSLLYAFHVWRHARTSMVGFYPRWHEKLADGTYAYRHWRTVVSNGVLYSMVLTKAAFHSAGVMALYWDDAHTPAPLREMVDKNKNCEDILLACAHANATGVPPVWVYGSLEDTGWYDGISTGGGVVPQSHAPKRHECLTSFARHYGGSLPLVASATYAHPPSGALSRALSIPVPSYSWQPPTWLEYFAPA